MEKLKVIDSEKLLNMPFPKQFFVVEGLILQGSLAGRVKSERVGLCCIWDFKFHMAYLLWDLRQQSVMFSIFV